MQVRAEMAAESGRVGEALAAQQARMAALMERAAATEAQSAGAFTELQRVSTLPLPVGSSYAACTQSAT